MFRIDVGVSSEIPSSSGMLHYFSSNMFNNLSFIALKHFDRHSSSTGVALCRYEVCLDWLMSKGTLYYTLQETHCPSRARGTLYNTVSVSTVCAGRTECRQHLKGVNFFRPEN